MVFYRNFRDALSVLPPEQRLLAYEAIFAYGLDGIRPEGGVVGAMVQLIIPAIDKNNQRYENGKKGGRPKKPNVTKQEPNNNQTEPNVTNPEPKGKRLNVKGKVLKDNDSNRRFTPPTPEEVRQYCNERRNNVNPEQFCDFYTAKGWKVGNNPMKDWKAAVRTWERRKDHSATTFGAGMVTGNEDLSQFRGRNGNLI